MGKLILLFGAFALLFGDILCDVSSAVTASVTVKGGTSPPPPPPPPPRTVTGLASGGNQGELNEFRKFQQSNLYVAPFEDNVIALPPTQLDFVRLVIRNDLELIRAILREAIQKRNNLIPPNISLMWKYSGVLLGNFIRNRQAEQRLHPKVEPKPSFFSMLANMIEKVLDRSTKLKKENHYDKRTVYVEALYERVDALLKYIEKIVDHSPVGGYLKWNTMTLYKGETLRPEHDLDFIEEAADLTAVSNSFSMSFKTQNNLTTIIDTN